MFSDESEKITIKNDKLYFTKNLKFCLSKDTIQMNRQTTDSEKYS